MALAISGSPVSPATVSADLVDFFVRLQVAVVHSDQALSSVGMSCESVCQSTLVPSAFALSSSPGGRCCLSYRFVLLTPLPGYDCG